MTDVDDNPPTVEQICRAIARREARAERRLAVAEAYIGQLERRIEILQKRINHADIETAHARLSRDAHVARLADVLNAVDEAGFEVIGLFGGRE